VTEKKKRKLFTGGSVVRVTNVKPDYRTKMSDNAKKKESIFYNEEIVTPLKDTDEKFLCKNIMS
jgi:hypothetical protein